MKKIKQKKDDPNKRYKSIDLITIVLASIAIVISMRSCYVSSKSNEISLESNKIALESKQFSEGLQTLQKRTEKLYKLAQIAKNLEDNVFYLRTNMPENENCRKDYLDIIYEAEKTIKSVNSHYNYIKDEPLNSNDALKIEISMPDIDKLNIETSQLIEKSKNTVKFCKENHQKESKK